MRGDMTVFKADTILGLVSGDRFLLDGNRIAFTNGAGVAKRDSEKSFRVSINSETLKAIAGDAPGKEVPVRFIMTLNTTKDGGRVYLMVPAGDKAPQAVIKTRT